MTERRYRLDLAIDFTTDGDPDWAGYRVGHDTDERIREVIAVDLHDQWERRHRNLDEPLIRFGGIAAWSVHEIHEPPREVVS